MNLLKTTKKRAGKITSWFISLSIFKKAFFLALLLITGWFISSKVFVSKSNKPQYQTAVAQKQTLVSSVSVSGTVSSASSASITTQATGVVSSVNFKNGDYVNQGDAIATITLDQASQQKQAAAWASYLSAQNSLNSANAQLFSIRSVKYTNWQAYMNFATSGNYNTPDQQNTSQYQTALNNWLAAEANEKNQQGVISQTQASVNSAWLSYQQTSSTITAPISGTVSNLKIASGTPLLAPTTASSSSNNSTVAQTIGNVTLQDAQPQATVNLTEIDVTSVKLGQKVTLTLDAFSGKTFTGHVTAIDTNGTVSSGVTTYPTTITFDNAPQNMYPNMTVSAQIITNVSDNVLTVPTQAIQTQNGTSYVRVLKDGRVQQVDVTLGNTSDTDTQITSGVNEGDTIVTSTVTTTSTGAGTASPFGRSLGGFGGGGVRVGGGGRGGN